MTNKITIAYGDGIGPEIMQSCVKVLDAAGADLIYDEIKIGEKIYLSGNTSGIADSDWDKLMTNKIFLKAPITTPQGGGYKSLNVTIRKTLGLYANVRPVKSLFPYVDTKHPKMDMVIVRENEEDLYAGIEHRQTNDVYQCLKLISRPGSEKIIRFAFEYTRSAGRKKLTCMIKDNIMKLTDGLFHQVFNEVAKEYPEIATDHYIIDIGTARLADTPQDFDVIVLPNLYGDILSDVAAQIAGSVGLAGSANIGNSCSMFEAIHGSAPDIAGQNIANPSGLLMGSVAMLNYIGKNDIAAKIENAWLRTIEDGIHTGDIFKEGTSKEKVSTTDFTKALIENLGNKPNNFAEISYPQKSQNLNIEISKPKIAKKTLEGIDVFLDHQDLDAKKLGDSLAKVVSEKFELVIITNRGVKVYPQGNPLTFCTDHWRCRFMATKNSNPDSGDIIKLLENIKEAGFDFIKTENLYNFDGKRGYSLGQGQ